MTQVSEKVFVKTDELNSGSKLIMAYDSKGEPLLIKGRFSFYDTKFRTVS